MKHFTIASIVLIAATAPAFAAQPSVDAGPGAAAAAKDGGVNPKKPLDRNARKFRNAKAKGNLPPLLPPLPPPVAMKAPPVPPDWPAFKPTAVLLIRDAYSVQSFISETLQLSDPGTAKLSDNGASLSYTRDGVANTQTIAGKGAVFYAYSQWIAPTTNDPNVVRLAHYSVVPGVEWDVKTKNNLHQVSGPVSAMVQSEFLIRSPWVATSVIRTNAVYTTDASDGRSQVYGAEFGWQPIIPQLRIGTTTQLSRDLDLWLGFYPTLNSDYFHVGNKGDFANLVTGRDYLWIGPKLQADLSFHSGMLERYSFFLKYFYLYDSLNNGGQNVNYGQVGAKAKLIEWKDANDAQLGDLSLLLRYTNGKAVRTLEQNNELYAGVTLKFGNVAADPSKRTE
jgi:hypothetical protein